MFEMGVGQERQLKILFDRAKAYEPLSFVADSRGRPRVALAARAVSS